MSCGPMICGLIHTGLILRTLGPSDDFTLLNGWICLHGVLD